ncbi:hypothetical protein, partial [Rubneribacter badeniensis]|uniref:hypothetical protein n=1 Tax=Rubneribacter badeniensis TaxID=2070688 RepID=UPI003A8D2C7C
MSAIKQRAATHIPVRTTIPTATSLRYPALEESKTNRRTRAATQANSNSNNAHGKRGCGQKVGHSGVRIGVRMYPLETRELAVEAVAAGFSLTEAAELAG